jgi:hypothetical protein
MESAAAEAGLGQSLGSIGAGGSLEIQQSDTRTGSAYDEFQDSSAKRMVAELGGDFVPGARYGLTSPLFALTHNGTAVTGAGGDPPELVRYYEGLQSHVHLVAGAWPAAGTPVGYFPMTVPQSLAVRIDLTPGDLYCLRARVAIRRPPRRLGGPGVLLRERNLDAGQRERQLLGRPAAHWLRARPRSVLQLPAVIDSAAAAVLATRRSLRSLLLWLL